MDSLQFFQDRDKAIQAFDNFWQEPRTWIMACTGFSGNGKSTLLEWLVANRCNNEDTIHASISLGGYAGAARGAFHALLEAPAVRRCLTKREWQAYQTGHKDALHARDQQIITIQMKQEMKDAAGAQQTIQANLAEALREIDRQANERYRDAWIECIATLPQDRRLVFLIDDYDLFQERAIREEVCFFWHVLEAAHHHLPALRVVIASREALRHQDELRVLQTAVVDEPVEPLAEPDSTRLLEKMGVTDPAFCRAVYQNLAQGHPLITRMAGVIWKQRDGGIEAGEIPQVTSSEEAVEWVQGRILDRLPEPLKTAARWAALLRWFDAEMLNAILQIALTPDQFRAFTHYAFVRSSALAPGKWTCHDLVCRVQAAYLQRERPAEFADFHRRAGEWHLAHNQDLEALYHRLYYDTEAAYKIWENWVSEAAFEFDHPRWFRLLEIGRTAAAALTGGQLAEVHRREGYRYYFLGQQNAAMASYAEALQLFRAVGARLGEANVLQAMGDVQQFRDERDAALASYAEALRLFREVGARLGEANVLQAIGDVQQFRDERDAALASYAEALRLFREVGARLGEANVLQAIGNVQQFRDERDAALASYAEALRLFREVGDRLGEANVLQAIGNVQQFRDERDAALASYAEALRLFREVGDRLGEANVLKAIGDVQQFRDERDAAMASYAEALRLFRKVGARLGEANVLKAIGNVQQFRDERDAALASYAEALRLFREVGDRLGEANVLKAIGDVQQFLKENDAAMASYADALQLYRAVGARIGEANVLKAMGDVQQFRKENDAAMASYADALQLYRAVGARLGEANALRAIGDVQQFRKETAAAMASYADALRLYRSIGDRLGEANALKAMGDVQQYRKECDAAQTNYGQALWLYQAIQEQQGEAEVLLALGDMRQLSDDSEEAQEKYTQALTIFREIGDRQGEANALLGYGKYYFRQYSDTSSQISLENFHSALEIYRQIGDLYGQVNTLNWLAKWHEEYGDIHDALSQATQALGLAQNVIPDHPDTALLSQFVADLKDRVGKVKQG